MKITKYGHACLLVEEAGARIVVDPGNWNAAPDALGVDAILVTHDHGDHCDLGQIKGILDKSPGARVITHEAVGKLLAPEGIAFEALEDGAAAEVKGVAVESHGAKHAIIYGDMPQCRNTGFLIAGRLFVTGDALHDVPHAPVEILALPTGGPWMKIGEAVDYAKKVKPKFVFPVHDAMYTDMYQRAVGPAWMGKLLSPDGIEFRDLPAGGALEF